MKELSKELVEALETYIEFIEKHLNQAEGLRYVHGFRHSQEDIDKGIVLRSNIADAKANYKHQKEDI